MALKQAIIAYLKARNLNQKEFEDMIKRKSIKSEGKPVDTHQINELDFYDLNRISHFIKQTIEVKISGRLDREMVRYA